MQYYKNVDPYNYSEESITIMNDHEYFSPL